MVTILEQAVAVLHNWSECNMRKHSVSELPHVTVELNVEVLKDINDHPLA